MVLLFLRPEAALGIALVVEQPQNDRNSEPGFKLLDETTGKPETVTIKAEVRFDGGTEIFKSATLDIVQETGDARFVDVVGLALPISGLGNLRFTGDDLTTSLPASGDGNQGSLIV